MIFSLCHPNTRVFFGHPVQSLIVDSPGQHPSLRGSGKALATVTAIIDGTGSVGAAIGPFLAGALSGGGKWGNVFYMLMGADVLALLFLTRLVYQEYRRWSIQTRRDDDD